MRRNQKVAGLKSAVAGLKSAIENNQQDKIQEIINANKQLLTQMDESGKFALIWAIECNKSDIEKGQIINLLLAKGANPRQTFRGLTPRDYCARENNHKQLIS